MKSPYKISIVVIILDLLSLSILAQSEKIIINSPITTPIKCETLTDGVGRKYQVIVPYTSIRVISSRGAMMDVATSQTTVSFEFNPATETASCNTDQNGFDIRFVPKNGQITSNRSGGTVSGSNQLGGSNNQNTGSLNSQNTSISSNQNTGSSITTPARSQSLTLTPKEKQDAEKKKADLSVPESPGFTILGLTPQTVIRPATPRQFATSLLNGLDESGNFQTGVAIDTVPYLLFYGNNLFLGNDKTGYRAKTASGYLTRLLSRTQFSLATTKGTSEDDKSAKIGTGLHVTVFDYGDPRLDKKFDECFNGFTQRIRSQAEREIPDFPTNFERYNARLTELAEEVRADYVKECIEASRKRNFARSSFIIGGAGSWISKTGDSSKFTYNGAGIWTSLSYGFEGIPGLEEKSQIILHFRRRIKETVPDPLNQGKFTTKDSNLFGMRLRFGVPNWTGNVEGVYQGEHFAGRKADSNFKLSFGSDYKLADNLYLNFAVGGETKKSVISNNKVFVRTSFNWGTSQKPLN